MFHWFFQGRFHLTEEEHIIVIAHAVVTQTQLFFLPARAQAAQPSSPLNSSRSAATNTSGCLPCLSRVASKQPPLYKSLQRRSACWDSHCANAHQRSFSHIRTSKQQKTIYPKVLNVGIISAISAWMSSLISWQKFCRRAGRCCCSVSDL